MTATAFTRAAGVEVPLVCGAMYPCSNPELVAAASEAGALGVVQPIAFTYVHGHGLREGLQRVRRLTRRPIGFNALIERSSSAYLERMRGWLEVALEEGVRFVVTSLGDPRWVVERVHAAGGVVYHDATEARWAAKARDAGVDGLVGVNRLAGGHPGTREPQALLDELAPFALPVLCAGGVGDADGFAAALRMGYAGVQCGTRFIATPECRASEAYKQAIVRARAADVVLSERITGVPVAVLDTPAVRRMGLTASPLERRLLRGRRTRHWLRALWALRSVHRLKRAALDERAQYWQAGRSVETIHAIEPVGEIVRRWAEAADRASA
ncbi:MAG TPA: nitronate monooxygenase [Candidatus Eisenbacteria bacterium]|nr:nitronate monooxygenase [Candidatus Eisenbacteria bacterium]